MSQSSAQIKTFKNASDGRIFYGLQTPYNAEFVDELKAALPAAARKWDATRKCWIVAEAALPTVKPIFDKYFGPEAEEAALDAEIEQIKANQAYILEREERINSLIADLAARISRYSFRSASHIKAGLVTDRALLSHSLDNARLPVEQLTELQVRGLAAAVRYLEAN